MRRQRIQGGLQQELAAVLAFTDRLQRDLLYPFICGRAQPERARTTSGVSSLATQPRFFFQSAVAPAVCCFHDWGWQRGQESSSAT